MVYNDRSRMLMTLGESVASIRWTKHAAKVKTVGDYFASTKSCVDDEVSRA